MTNVLYDIAIAFKAASTRWPDAERIVYCAKF